tara:strand:+ start:264994 stop:266427 length:1434 start_codon:yes stop_codon:yes gene_type:complete
MKIKTNNLSKIVLALLAVVSFWACDNDDLVPEFTLQEVSEQVAFTNSPSNEYLISTATGSNIAERFVWNQPGFGVQTEVNYKVEGALSETFSNIVDDSGVLSITNYAITVEKLMAIALNEDNMLEVDTDPNTTDANGDPNNTFEIYFRVKAFVGSGDGQDAKQSTSETITLNITLIEETGEGNGIDVSEWGIVGSATPNGWDGPDVPFYTTSQNNVIVAYATLVDGQIKIRQNNSWDAPNINYGDLTGDGILDTENDNNINVTAGTYKITIDWSDKSYTIEEFYWGLVGSATPNSWDGPDVKLTYDYNTDTFKAVVQLVDGQMKVRMNDSWDAPNINYGDLTGDGILDTENDNNINVTAGYYLVTVNFNTLEYSIEETLIWGAVGSATPNSWDGPDTKFTPDFANPGIWKLKGLTLVDGQLKFRTNDSWDAPNINYGDLTGDGILDSENDNNINVTAGTYDITLDFSDPDNPAYTIE